jgi:transposase-like protein
MVKAAVGLSPNSISCDYELAILKAIKAVFKTTEISGCYFHLTQNLFKDLSKNKLFTNFTSKSDGSVRKSFNFLKTLVFVPIDDVLEAFF